MTDSSETAHPSVLQAALSPLSCGPAHRVDLLSRALVPVERAHNGPRMRRACSSTVFAPARSEISG